MSRAAVSSPSTLLSSHEGMNLFSAAQALLKGIFESESEISLLTGPATSLAGTISHLASDASVAQLAREHHLRMSIVPTSSRGIGLALHSAMLGSASMAVVPNLQLDQSMAEFVHAARTPLQRGAMVMVLEDDPSDATISCPRRAAAAIDVPTIEPGDLEQLRESVELAVRLSRAGRVPTCIVVHRSILQSIDTLESRPNRVLGPVETALLQRRRSRAPRWSEAGGVLRMARRMELNRFRAMPSPGERVSVGFVTVGPADASLLHLTHNFQLHGRVPVLQLGLIHPIDDAAVERLLDRCQQVIVLEPRPGSVEPKVLDVAEKMRRRGDDAAIVWGRTLPTDPANVVHAMSSDADLHPSMLVRKIAHLLHAIRPTAQISSQLTPDPPALAVTVPPRETVLGAEASLEVIRRMVTDTDQWLRERAPLQERNIPPTALAIDGIQAAGAPERTVVVETWEHARFQRDGLWAIVQAALDSRPWIMLVSETAGHSIRDLERLARGVIPAERADRVTLETANLNDRIALRDMIREAALLDRMTIIIVRDGPPARFDPAAIDEALADIDRLGFEPQQRIVHPADDVCSIRAVEDIEGGATNEERSTKVMQTSVSVDTLTAEAAPKFRLRVRPLLEEAEVVRTRPPRHAWQTERMARLTPPQSIHAKQSIWRMHLAGYRGESPGAAAKALLAAGRNMGYHVRCIHDQTPMTAGWRAWSQVLFTHPRPNEEPLQVTATIPFGEADVLLGIDAAETLRAVAADYSLRIASPSVTSAVVNSGAAVGAAASPQWEPHLLGKTLDSVTRPGPRMVEDFYGACRTWFYTDRVVDFAMLGAAFQLGLIPVTIEAMESALASIEASGFGRSREAFDFGRRLTVDSQLFAHPVDEREEDVNRLARRMVLSLSRREWGGGSRAKKFHALIHGSLNAMPGLTETEAGRNARRDYVLALYRCVAWGGIDYAQHYAELITSLYRVDRGDRGRALTRNAVLPLAEAMLMRDPIYIATMAASSEQQRRTRHQLNVKEARGDRLERRYLTRVELIAFNRRVRADVRTSDWPARLVAMSRRVIPRQWRGSQRERELREYVMDLIRRATDDASLEYDRWSESLSRLHDQAAEDRLRGMALAEVKMLVEPSPVLVQASGAS